MESQRKCISIDRDTHKILQVLAVAEGKHLKEVCGEIVREHYREVRERLSFPELREQ